MNDLDFKASWTAASDEEESFLTIETIQPTSEIMNNSVYQAVICRIQWPRD